MEPIDVQLKGFILYAGQHKIEHTHAHRPQKIDIADMYSTQEKSKMCPIAVQRPHIMS